MLKGYKTYIIGAIIIGVCLCAVFDVISKEDAVWFIGIMIGCGFITLRSGVNQPK